MENTKRTAILLGAIAAMFGGVIFWVWLCSLPFGTQTLAFPALVFGIPFAGAFAIAAYKDFRA